ncbi:hypothetical protein SETIT_2G245600v2 [Setaria italica]|uniref:25S rRNA (uridine-N(3))-methyltransferase BMT5-like domain-containing protein n=1 Tax=Setaria italica TaxID=4555 RepID=A0A368Q278_SETIT|nr:hypothetical protein SETIT_2G245600v2 [Setaria italica]
MADGGGAIAGGSREGVSLPAGIVADGRRQGDRAEGVPVIDLTAEEEKEWVGSPCAKEVQVIGLTAAGEEEKEGQGVDGPRAEGVPVIDLTGESSDEEEGEQEVKWVGHYSSTQSILLVGDGDFSFSLALATGFGSGANLVATSLDCYDTLKKYSGAESNLAELKKLGAVTLHGVNAKTMILHTDLKMRRFDRVVFNFPHAGFKGKENQPHMINLQLYPMMMTHQADKLRTFYFLDISAILTKTISIQIGSQFFSI